MTDARHAHAEPSPSAHDAAGVRPTSGPVDSPAAWDERYATADQLWSGEPNAALVRAVAGLPPGRALDVGCGEGADAVWLARRGWDVTALDVSAVALDRAARHAEDAGVRVSWLHRPLEGAPLEPGSFDLVSAQYPVLARTPTAEAERMLVGLVAPHGVLLVVHHADVDVEHAKEQGWDPGAYVSPTDVAAGLDDGWVVELDEHRPREVRTGAGSHHSHDVVLRATRVG